MPAPEKIVNLVKHFEEHLDDLKSKEYKELQLCSDFINPLFRELGWDVDNEGEKSEKYRDVIQQFRLNISGSSKAPDYLFRIGGSPAFFVEAKKPSVDINSAKDPAYQLRRYGWNKKDIDVSILTDFEDFSVYNCQIKPLEGDEPHVGRIARYTYKQFITHWDEIESIFSKANVEKGSLEKLLKEKTIKGIRETVDETFLKMIEDWRALLAKNLALRNPSLDVKQLNFSVQQTIDRIIFLRIAEDRGIEPLNRLLGLINGPEIYGRLASLFKDADRRYNSGLFHFSVEKDIPTPPDNLSLGLQIDDKVLKEMIINLYPPKSPFDFSAMPADILGQVYERFLGKVIRLTEGHRAVVDEKPEVRKAGGVYYTPTYIVDYIVSNTVGRLVEGKTPAEVAKLKILDPACGSGSFLIGAYQFLLDWHLEWYNKKENDPEKWAKGKNPAICQQKLSDGSYGWRLTTEKRKEILLNNIYGVDIDRQAVEVTKLNLLLKVLEQENTQDLFSRMERALPDLGANIKCGNSLIGSDFYDNRATLFDMEESYRVNAFDWDREFPKIIRWKTSPGGGKTTKGVPDLPSPSGGRRRKAADEGVLKSYGTTSKQPPHPDPLLKGEGVLAASGGQRELEDGYGFDAVIGNPPYIGFHGFSEEKNYFSQKYIAAKGKYDVYLLFIEQGLRLQKGNGLFGFICPTNFTKREHGKSLRGWLLKYFTIIEIIDFEDKQIFKRATNYTGIFIVLNKKTNLEHCISYKNNITQENNYLIPQSSLDINTWIFREELSNPITEKIKHNTITLSEICSGISEGIVSGKNDVFVIAVDLKELLKFESTIWRKCIRGKEIQRYSLDAINEVIFYPYKYSDNKTIALSEYELSSYEFTYKYLKKSQNALGGREYFNKSGKAWFELWCQRDIKNHETIKIVVPELADKNRFCIADNSIFYGDSVCGIVLKNDIKIGILYLLGLLNSKLIEFYYKKTTVPKAGGYYIYKTMFLKNIPIRTIDWNNKKDVECHDKMVKLVEQMLDLNKKLRASSTPDEKAHLERAIGATDRQIDQLVYELYDLTPEEIAIIEEQSK